MGSHMQLCPYSFPALVSNNPSNHPCQGCQCVSCFGLGIVHSSQWPLWTFGCLTYERKSRSLFAKLQNHQGLIFLFDYHHLVKEKSQVFAVWFIALSPLFLWSSCCLFPQPHLLLNLIYYIFELIKRASKPRKRDDS